MTEKRNDAPAEAVMSRRKLLAYLGAAGASLAAGTAMYQDYKVSAEGTNGRADAGNTEYTMQSLKQAADLAEGMVVTTYGYYRIGDGGGADYVIKRSTDREDRGSVVNLANGLQAHLLPAGSIGYKMFGAVGDGQNDDGVQMKNAHDYANKTGLPVVQPSGEFWLKATQQITIKTNVQWGHTKFHIDEKFKGPKFQVVGSKEAVPIKLDKEAKASFLSKLKPGTTLISELAPYKNCLVVVQDDNDRIGFRQGFPNQKGWARTEFFYVEEHGRLIGDIAWTFKDYTSLMAYPCEDNYLTIDGGTFYLSGESPPDKYVLVGIAIRRSRTRICNQWIGLEPGKTDVALNARAGFYNFNTVYDVLLENVRLIPFVYDRGDPKQNVPDGTYGINGGLVLCSVFRNVTAEGSNAHWGVFGTNLYKNFRVEQCRLNRIDVHFHGWNLYFRDCEIGYKRLTLTGGGDLFIENTRIYGNAFLNLRSDYGGKWDGDIRITNSRLIVTDGAQEARLIESMMGKDFDYKYPVGHGRSIRIEDFVFDYSCVPKGEGTIWLMKLPAFSKQNDGQRLFFPSLIECRNVRVEGRDKGVRIVEIKDASGYLLRKKGGYDGQMLTPNCIMRFDNVQLEKMPEQAPKSTKHVNFLLNGAGGETQMDEYSLYPSIQFTDCGDFFGHVKGIPAEVEFKRCVLNGMDTNEGGPMQGSIVFDRCRFKANASDDGNPFFSLETTLGTYFTNCSVQAPVVGGNARPDLVHRYGFISVNETLHYNHSHTKLAKEIVDYYAGQGVTIKPGFAAMLNSHSDSVWR